MGMFAWAKGLSLFFTGILLPLTLVINFFASSISDKLIKDLLGAEGHSYLILFLTPMRGFWKSLPVDYHTYALMALVFLSTVLVYGQMDVEKTANYDKKTKKASFGSARICQ